MGLLASRYAAPLADSISTSSFYSEEMEFGQHDPSKVIDIETFRQEFVEKYKAGIATLETHPVMRKFNDKECNENPNVEMATASLLRRASITAFRQHAEEIRKLERVAASTFQRKN
jgi:hypothetical protein